MHPSDFDKIIVQTRESEITKAIQKYMLEQKYKDSQGDVSANYTLTDKETRSAERMQESIAAFCVNNL